MKAFFKYLALFVVALIGGALLAYPLFTALHNVFEVEFERVASRCVLFLVIILFLVLKKFLGIHSWQKIGYNVVFKEFCSQCAKGILIGIAIMLPVIIGLLMTGNRVVDFDWDWSFTSIATLLLTAFISGIIIALIEETLFRGAMLTSIGNQSTVTVAIVITSLFFALVHFINPESSLNTENLSWLSGLHILKDAFIPFLHPVEIFDSFLALFLAGVLLALLKIRTQSLALCIGVHAGWVVTIKVFKRVTDTNVLSEFAFLTGSYDKVIGYLAAVCIVIGIVIVLRTTKSH